MRIVKARWGNHQNNHSSSLDPTVQTLNISLGPSLFLNPPGKCMDIDLTLLVDSIRFIGSAILPK